MVEVFNYEVSCAQFKELTLGPAGAVAFFEFFLFFGLTGNVALAAISAST